jgi:hypothetical protein
MENIIDLVDTHNKLNLPKEVFLNGQKYTGKAVFLNGFNGYGTANDDGHLAALIDNSAFKKGNANYLTDIEGNHLRAKERRGIVIVI